MIRDISPPITERLAVWPGDTPYSREILLSIDKGDNLDLSTIRTTLHLGAHADGPSHYLRDGQGIGERSLSRYLGSCQVIEVAVPPGTRITPADLSTPIRAQRVLFRTGTYPDPEVFNEDFAALSPALVTFLAAAGVVLVGIDTPSIDLCHDKALLSHTAVAETDLAVLEGLVLDDVPAGLYTLIALPLRISGADASPVRAVLLDEMWEDHGIQ